MRGYERLKFFPTNIEVLRVQYALTIDQWYDRAVGEEGSDRRAVRRAVLPDVDLLPEGAAAAFRTGGMVNYQIQLSRSRLTLPLTRDCMVESERSLRASDKDGDALAS